jgi:hypothetical protein
MVLDKKRNPVPVKLQGFFRAEIFSQNEVEGIADQKRFQLDLIDSFASADLASLDWSIDDIRDEIVRTARETEPLRQQIQALDEKIKQVPNLRERLKAFTMEGGDSAEEVNKAHAAKALRDRETRAVRASDDLIKRFHSDASELIGRLSQELTGKFSKELLASGATGGTRIRGSARPAHDRTAGRFRLVCMTFIQPFVSKGFPLVRFSGPYTVVASSCQMLKILP